MNRKKKAAAYYRCARTDTGEILIAIQREQVRAFVKKCGIDINSEFTDQGKPCHSGKTGKRAD